MLVEKIDLEDKKSPKIENFIFCFFNFHISYKKLLDTLRVPVSRTRAPVRIFGPIFTHVELYCKQDHIFVMAKYPARI